ncbi:MAG TPA: ankyrin repeat domain-containing protein [Chthonomonadaceae bacterium]|nr:ankyrin repeat domain-containing protein [Chthonomonadaceae bacterium]
MGTAPKLDALYEKIGGMQTCRQISELFHDRIAGDPVLRAVFPKNLAPTTEWLALFLAERLGGPADYRAKRGKQSLRCRHAHIPIGPKESERWLYHMFATIDQVGISDPARQTLRNYFTETAATLSDPFLSLYHLPLNELHVLLEQNPALATTSDIGRTLISAAAGEWDLPRVQLLLEHGADVHVKGALGHDPLYRAANALAPGRESEGRAVVELLIQHGANVNGRSGPGQMTALHMAARRGTVTIAEVLLTSGAEIEARDIKGETPLRRAVNCRQEGMVRLLLSHGADPLAQDNRGCTALAAARQERIREALQEALRRRT